MTTIHPLVLQLKFTRSEFKRALKGLSEGDAGKRLLPMNCISWNVGHLSWQEQKYILYLWARTNAISGDRRAFCIWGFSKYPIAARDAENLGEYHS